MFVDPIIMQFPENLDSENFVIATYYCATKPTTNMVKFAAALAIEQTCGTWLKVPGETPEVRERAIGRVVGVYEAPSYQIGIPADVTERHFIVRIAYPWHNFGAQFSMMLSTVIGNISSSGKVKLIDLEFPKSFLAEMKGPKFGVPGIRELLRDGVNGRLVPPGNPEALADALEASAGEPGTLDRFRAAARETAEANSWRAVAGQYIQLFERTIAVNGRPVLPE